MIMEALSNKKVTCAICGHEDHILAQHITTEHEMSPLTYMEEHPGHSWLSDYGKALADEAILRQPRKRKLVDPAKLFPKDFGLQVAEGGTPVPVFAEPDHRTPKRNKNYALPPVAASEFLTIVMKEQRNNIYVAGPTGSGKSTLVEYMAALCNAPLWKINGDAYFTRSHFLGSWRVKGGSTYFQYGVIPQWLRYGGWLLINEYDTLPPEVVNCLKSVMEEERCIALTENGDEEIVGHPDCRLIVTANTLGRGDDTGLYVNTEIQSAADLRRFHGFILVDYLDATVETAMLVKQFPALPVTAVTLMVEVANLVRAAYKARKLLRPLSTAELVTWADNYSWFDSIHHAAEISFLNGFDPTLAAAVRETITIKFGEKDSEVLLSKEIAARGASKAPDKGEE